MATYRRMYRRLFIVGFLLLPLVPLMCSHAQDSGLRETFDDPTLPGWERSPDVTIADGVLLCPR